MSEVSELKEQLDALKDLYEKANSKIDEFLIQKKEEAIEHRLAEPRYLERVRDGGPGNDYVGGYVVCETKTRLGAVVTIYASTRKRGYIVVSTLISGVDSYIPDSYIKMSELFKVGQFRKEDVLAALEESGI